MDKDQGVSVGFWLIIIFLFLVGCVAMGGLVVMPT